MAKKAPTAQHTFFVRGFPRELSRQVASAAVLRGITVGEMLAILVRDALPRVRSLDEQNAAALRTLGAVRRAAGAAGVKA